MCIRDRPILVEPPVNPPSPLPWYRYRSPVLVSPRMSALPSPVKSPGENTLAKTFHPEPILVAAPANLPSPLPWYRYRSPVPATPRMSALPSPVKSPGENTLRAPLTPGGAGGAGGAGAAGAVAMTAAAPARISGCLLYTSDAADE